MQPGPADGDAPPPGTAIVRPLRHVRAVREHYLRRFTDQAAADTSPSARAWSWALGETAAAPVSDRQTATPPTRSDIEAEITEADRRRRDGERARADAAATVLRWLIGHDDHVPVRTDNPGELVGGFGAIVRSPNQIASVLSLAAERLEQIGVGRSADRAIDYLEGVSTTLSWALGERPAPVSGRLFDQRTAGILKPERLHAEDVVQQAGHPQEKTRSLSAWYGQGVERSIAWLLGDLTGSLVLDDV